MAKIESVIIEEPWEYNELYPILQDAFRVLYFSYNQLYSLKKETPYIFANESRQLENFITNDLIKQSSYIIKKYEYRFQKQQEDFETNVKIDIAVQYSLKFDDNTSDLKIECKRLDNISYIVSDGFNSFKNNKYSEKLSLSGMLLYNTKDEINDNIDKLNERIETKINKDEVLQHLPSLIEGYQYTYKSTHTRTNNTNLDLYSCAFDFKDLIIR